MEEDARNIHSPLLTKPEVERQFERLDHAVEESKKRIDLTMSSNEEIVQAIRVVERFLRRKRRLCYGGQAINAQLPAHQQFYDPKVTLPDYDFFSPNFRGDVDELIEDLEKAGFKDINKKMSVHEGTIKVLVNFIPVADCSELHPELFRILQRRARAVDGIYFVDPDFLRMLMYLELSRPRGEVERWKKVYERLTLLNANYPPGKCDESIRVSQSISTEDREILLNFAILHKRLLMGPEFLRIFLENKHKVSRDWFVKQGGPVIWLSHKAKVDAEDCAAILQNTVGGGGKLRIKEEFAKTDQLFDYVMIYRRNQPLALIFQEDSCHSYTTTTTDGGTEVRVGTVDTYLHLYYTLLLFGKKEKAFFQTSLQCLVDKVHTLEHIARNNPTRLLPAFGIRCSGTQKGISELLKERAERTEREKKSGTRSSKKNRLNSRRQTRRSL
jgi:hypothetical protein